MAQHINLAEYSLVVDEESGEVEQLGGNIVLKHNSTQLMISVPYEDVAVYFNLGLQFPDDNGVEKENHTEIFKWSDDQTKMLLMLYEEHFKRIGPMKKFRTKKHMWNFIAVACSEQFGLKLTPDQVEGRFKTVLKKTKATIKNNRTSGAVRKDIPYSSFMGKIIKNDDSLFPEVFIGPNKIVRKENGVPAPNLLSTSSSTTQNIQALSSSNLDIEEVQPQSPSSSVGNVDVVANRMEESLTESNGPTPRKKQKCLSEKMVDRLIRDKQERSLAKEEAKQRRHQEKIEALAQFGKNLMSVLQEKSPNEK